MNRMNRMNDLLDIAITNTEKMINYKPIIHNYGTQEQRNKLYNDLEKFINNTMFVTRNMPIEMLCVPIICLKLKKLINLTKILNTPINYHNFQ